MAKKKSVRSSVLKEFKDNPASGFKPLSGKQKVVNPFREQYDYTQSTTTRGTKRKGQYKGGKRSKAELSWNKDEYSTQNLNRKDFPELTAEYSRLRSIIRKRFETIAKNQEYAEHSKIYKKYKDTFVSVKEIKNFSELVYLLNQAAYVLSKSTSSMRGLKHMRREFLKTMQKHPLYKNIVNVENYWNFVDFMDDISDASMKKMYDSKRFVEWFDSLEDKTNYIQAGKSLKESFENWGKQHIEGFEVYENEENERSNSEFFRKYSN